MEASRWMGRDGLWFDRWGGCVGRLCSAPQAGEKSIAKWGECDNLGRVHETVVPRSGEFSMLVKAFSSCSTGLRCP